MAIGAILKVGVAAVILGIVLLVIMGFYFTITSPSGQGFLVGGFESFAEAVYQFLAAPFIALGHMIASIPSAIGNAIHL